jgi:hypothetical protein
VYFVLLSAPSLVTFKTVNPDTLTILEKRLDITLMNSCADTIPVIMFVQVEVAVVVEVSVALVAAHMSMETEMEKRKEKETP